MRFPTFGKPRIISCAELHPRHVALPRGCLDEAVELMMSIGAQPQISDERQRGTPIAVSFLGSLHEAQAEAVAAIEPLRLRCSRQAQCATGAEVAVQAACACLSQLAQLCFRLLRP
jgi:hypothetical protein